MKYIYPYFEFTLFIKEQLKHSSSNQLIDNQLDRIIIVHTIKETPPFAIVSLKEVFSFVAIKDTLHYGRAHN